jgi:XTP/dITP diphosphohydrolase
MSERVLVLATNNHGKLRELEALLSGLPINVAPVTRFVPGFSVEETGRSFEENAILKACAAYQATSQLALADDSGLEVDALDGRPGVHSARYAGLDAPDQANNLKLLAELEGVADQERTARFVCSLALVGPAAGDLHLVSGHASGTILRAPQGKAGFGYDPLFYCAEYARSFAELSPVEKDRVSHRGRALQALLPVLQELLSRGSD